MTFLVIVLNIHSTPLSPSPRNVLHIWLLALPGEYTYTTDTSKQLAELQDQNHTQKHNPGTV